MEAASVLRLFAALPRRCEQGDTQIFRFWLDLKDFGIKDDRLESVRLPKTSMLYIFVHNVFYTSRKYLQWREKRVFVLLWKYFPPIYLFQKGFP